MIYDFPFGVSVKIVEGEYTKEATIINKHLKVAENGSKELMEVSV